MRAPQVLFYAQYFRILLDHTLRLQLILLYLSQTLVQDALKLGLNMLIKQD